MNSVIESSLNNILSYGDDVKTYLSAEIESEIPTPTDRTKTLKVSESTVHAIGELVTDLLDNFGNNTLIVDKTGILNKARLLISYRGAPLVELNVHNVGHDSLDEIKIRGVGNFSVGEVTTLEEWLFDIDRVVPSIDDPELCSLVQVLSSDKSAEIAKHLLRESSSIAKIEVDGMVSFATRLTESSVFIRNSNSVSNYDRQLESHLGALIDYMFNTHCGAKSIVEVDKRLIGSYITFTIKGVTAPENYWLVINLRELDNPFSTDNEVTFNSNVYTLENVLNLISNGKTLK